MTDLKLTTARRDLLSLDHAITKLREKFAADFERRADFIDAEERRFAALDCLATIQATSPAGMIAKAVKAVFGRGGSRSPGRDRDVACRRCLELFRPRGSSGVARKSAGLALAWPAR
ncbi:MAG: hypothetical protein WAK55_07280 [Xanthobacteraceae bacterium]